MCNDMPQNTNIQDTELHGSTKKWTSAHGESKTAKYFTLQCNNMFKMRWDLQELLTNLLPSLNGDEISEIDRHFIKVTSRSAAADFRLTKSTVWVFLQLCIYTAKTCTICQPTIKYTHQTTSAFVVTVLVSDMCTSTFLFTEKALPTTSHYTCEIISTR